MPGAANVGFIPLWLTLKNIKRSCPAKLFQLGCWEDTPALISFGLKDVATVPIPCFLSKTYGKGQTAQ